MPWAGVSAGRGRAEGHAVDVPSPAAHRAANAHGAQARRQRRRRQIQTQVQKVLDAGLFGLAFWLFNRPGATARPLVVNIGEVFFNWGGPIWIILVNNLWGGIEGRLKMHQIHLDTREIVATILLGVGACVVMLFVKHRGERVVDFIPGGNALPLKPFAVIQGSILLAMLLVSVPPQVDLANGVILGAYTVYLVVSGICAWQLYQRVGDVETMAYVTPAQRFRM